MTATAKIAGCIAIVAAAGGIAAIVVLVTLFIGTVAEAGSIGHALFNEPTPAAATSWFIGAVATWPVALVALVVHLQER